MATACGKEEEEEEGWCRNKLKGKKRVLAPKKRKDGEDGYISGDGIAPPSTTILFSVSFLSSSLGEEATIPLLIYCPWLFGGARPHPGGRGGD